MRNHTSWLAVIAAALTLAAVPAQPVLAQLPLHERLTTAPKVRRIVASFGRFYTTARLWRDQVRDRTDAALRRAEKLQSTRVALEKKAMGNLAVLGEKLPKYDNMGRRCAETEDLAKVCSGIDFLADGKIERVFQSTYRQWRDTTFLAIDRARENILGPLLGVSANQVAGAANDYVFGKSGLIKQYSSSARANHHAFSAMGTAFPAAMTLSSSARTMQIADSLDRTLQALTDSLEGVELSEGRASQIALRASLTDAWLKISTTRTEVLKLEAMARSLQQRARKARITESVLRSGANLQ